VISERLAGAWAEFQVDSGGVRRPATDSDYEVLIALLNDLTDNFDCTQEPYASLYDLLAGYAHAWELDHEPLKVPEVSGNEMLVYLMEDRGLTQYQLAQKGLVDQGNLSRILSGKRNISKDLAKRFAAYFGVDAELFI